MHTYAYKLLQVCVCVEHLHGFCFTWQAPNVASPAYSTPHGMTEYVKFAGQVVLTVSSVISSNNHCLLGYLRQCYDHICLYSQLVLSKASVGVFSTTIPPAAL